MYFKVYEIPEFILDSTLCSSKTYILVMQCFRVGYRGICHVSLVFSIYTQALGECVYEENTSDNFLLGWGVSGC